MIAEILLFLLWVFLLWKLLSSKPPNFPPGPTRWPILGNLRELREWGPFLYKSMAEMKRRYGDVAGFFVGTRPVVLVSGLDAIKELSFREDLAGRPTTIHQLMDGERYGILFIDGPRLKEQRRFSLRHLRDFGLGKTSMESITLEEIESVIEGVEELRGTDKQQWSKPVDVHNILGTAIINNIWHIISGKRYSFSDPKLNTLLGYVRKIVANNEFGGTFELAFPKLVARFPYITNLKKIRDLRDQLRHFIMEEMENHKLLIDKESPRDFMDSYMIEIDKRKDQPELTFTDKQLLQICFDLFGAGYDTTFNTITFSILFMILNPEIQLKVQEELDSVVGKDRFPSFQDRDRLHYCEATLQEVLRCSSVVPVAVPHAPLMKDVAFRGYVIPKGSSIFLNLYNHHQDSKFWGDPENFRPERFFDGNGIFKRSEAVIPFGIGKRACLGESLARNNLFLFFTCLMQKYSWRIPEGEQRPSDEPVGNITIVSKPFKVQVLSRK